LIAQYYHLQMVRKTGQENGVGIWEINGIKKIADRIQSRIDSFGYEFELETIYVIGSFGSGMGVPQKSDLDIAVSGVFYGALSQSELSNLQSKLAGHIMDGDILHDFIEFDELDLYVNDPAHIDGMMRSYATFEPVETYYDLLKDRKIEYT